MEINKSIALETHPPTWECYRLVAQGRDKAPVLHSSIRGKRHLLPNRYKDTKGRINHYKHPRAGKGSELYSPQCKISVTHSYYIHYKIYHYRNTIYPSQISTWTNLGFYFFNSMTRSTNLSPLFLLLLNVILVQDSSQQRHIYHFNIHQLPYRTICC